MNKDNFLAEMGSRIKQRRESIGLTQGDLADITGYSSHSSIAKIESGAVDLPQTKIKLIADALKTSPAYILGIDFPNIKNISPIETRKIPLLGNIACGEPVMAQEEHECYVFAGSNIHADFCLHAKGDSMIGARILDGDIVFVRKQEYVENGEIAVVLIGDEATLKRVYYHPQQKELILQPENPKYSAKVFRGTDLEQVKILGKAIAFQSDVR